MKIIHILTATYLILTACEKPEIIDLDAYHCKIDIELDSEHPKSDEYQSLLEKYRRQDLVGGIALVKDKEGLWMGADGLADIENDIQIKPCQPFLIASITKMFTATAILMMVDNQKINLDQNIASYLSSKTTNRLANAKDASVRQVLNHTSGIPDFYDNSAFELRRFNVANNHFNTTQILNFAKGLKPYFEIGTDYEYSNTNYLLLGLVLEKLLDKPLGEIFQELIFDKIGLESAYYDAKNPKPEGLIKGYAEPIKSEIIATEWLYLDELGTGDGGIAINIYHLYLFAEALFEGDLLSQNAINEMLIPITLNSDDSEMILGHQKNGLGVEIYDTPEGGEGFGHTGGIDGYSSYLMYFPSNNSYVIYFQNLASYDIDSRVSIINGLTKISNK
jgi:D-alanyl-D-alanine carboxypeptidase